MGRDADQLTLGVTGSIVPVGLVQFVCCRQGFMLEICLFSIDLRECEYRCRAVVVICLYSRVVTNFLAGGTCAVLPECAVQNTANSGRQCTVTTGTVLVPWAGHSQ